MKKILTFILILVLSVSAVFPALAVVDQSDEYYVADYANVFTDDFEKRIIALNGDLEHYCDGAQLVVVTVEYLDGMYSDEYAMTLFNNWGVGSADENNGMLLLLATKENKAWLTVGRGISLSTSEIDEMFEDYFWYDFDNGNFQEATEKMLDVLTLWYVDAYNVETSDNSPNGMHVPERPEEQDDTLFFAIWFIFLIVVIILLVTSSARGYRTFRHNGGSLSFFPWFIYNSRYRTRFRPRPPHRSHWDNDDDHFGGGGFGGFGGGGSGGSSGGGFGGFGGFGGGGGFGGSGGGGGGFGGGGGGRR